MTPPARPFAAAASGAAPLPWGFAAAAAFAALLAVPAAGAQTTGDNLQWIGGTAENSWTSPNPVWNDIGAVQAGPGPISLATPANQALTYGFFFVGNTPDGKGGFSSTVAPATMSVSANLNANYLSFTDGFAANNSMTIGNGTSSSPSILAHPLNFVGGWGINDRATSGTITFNPSVNGNNGVLYFTLAGAGSISPNTGSSIVINVVMDDGASAGSVSKSDGGTLTLAGANQYTGGTTVTGGTLIVTAGSTVTSGTGTGAVNVSNTGTVLAGTGVVDGATTINAGAVLSPGTGGNTVAKFQLGSGAVTSGLRLNGDLRVDLVGGGTTAGVNNDQILVAGPLTLNATSSRLVFGSVDRTGLAVGQKFFLALNDGTDPVVGTFSGLLQGATVTDPAGDTYTISYLDNGDNGTVGNDVSLTVTGVVPEPSAVALLAFLGLTVVVGGSFRRVRRAWAITGK